MYFCSSVLLLLLMVQGQAKQCILPNGDEGECIALSTCPAITEGLINPLTKEAEEAFRKLVCERGTRLDPKVCCTVLSNSTVHLEELSDRRYCGLQHTDDYISKRNGTSIDEFPWLAAIKAYNKYHKEEWIRCLGSLISARYVLTAAHCFHNYPVTGIRLGEFSISNDTDCIDVPQHHTEDCGEIQDFGVEKIIEHPLYEFTSVHDIALVRLNKTVLFSDYIRPICLPIPGTTFAKLGETLYTSGWGFLSNKGNKADIKKKVPTTLITGDACQKSMASMGFLIPSNVYGMCTVDPKNNTEVSCVGDDGAPVMFSHKHQWHLEGIVRGVVACGVETPIIQVRVSRYLHWIHQNIKP